MSLSKLFPNPDPWYVVAAVISVAIGIWSVLCLAQAPLPANSPKLIKGGWPILGSIAFFTQRWDFWRDALKQSETGSFSFHLAGKHIVGVSGDEGRKAYFDNGRALSLSAGYADLFAGSPDGGAQKTADGEMDMDFTSYFSKRIIGLLKNENLRKGIPALMEDVRSRLDLLAAEPSGITDPFDSIYRIVFQLTMRTVACNEIATDQAMLSKTLGLYEMVEHASTPTTILFPRLPTLAIAQRFYAGTRIYMIFNKIIANRKTGHREEDPLQYLLDQGDDTLKVITFIMGALFAGQLNSGINSAWILAYLGHNKLWGQKIRSEVEGVAAKYDSDTTKRMADRLANIPLEAWEAEFPLIDLCLRECIRLNTAGTTFRKNVSTSPVQIGDAVVPPGAYAAYHLADIHQDPEVYTNPMDWDPARFLPDRAEDKKKPYGFLGWGVGRHPCIGMRFAKLETYIIVAFFMAYFDWDVCDVKGNPTDYMPRTDQNRHGAHKPQEPVRLRYTLRA